MLTNLNSDTIEKIVNFHWKKCELMTEKDFDNLLISFDNYARTLSDCDTCKIQYLDTTIIYTRCHK